MSSAYRGPRHLNWVIGLGLFFLILLANYCRVFQAYNPKVVGSKQTTGAGVIAGTRCEHPRLRCERSEEALLGCDPVYEGEAEFATICYSFMVGT